MNKERLVPQLRFKVFEGEWEKKKLGDIADLVQGNEGISENLPILTISAKNGWMNQKDRFGTVMAGSELKRYTLLKKGQLSYNHGNSKLAKYGTVFELKNHNEALVPKVYHSFKMTEENDSAFIEQLFQSKIPDRQLRKIITSGARMDGLLNINKKSFFGIDLTVTSSAEQQKIGSFFGKMDKLIELYQEKTFLNKKYKKSLFQLMIPKPDILVPKIRFKEFKDLFYNKVLKDVIESELKGKAQAKMDEGDSPYLDTEYLNGGEKRTIDSPANVDYEDVLVLWDGSQAGTVYHGFKGALGSTLKAYKPKESGNYLYLYLKGNQQEIYHSYRSPNIPHVIKTFTSEFSIVVPSLPEQQKIGQLFQKLDQEINLYEQKIKQLKQLKKGYLQKLFC